jgi:sugar phosphate permease
MKKIKVFYGWWIVAAIFFISAYANGVVFYSFTAVLQPVVEEFGWSYAQVSFAVSIRGFETGIVGPVVGLLFDRFGPRRLIFTGAIIIGIGLVMLSRADSIIMFYGSFFLMAMGLSSCTGFILAVVIGNWFRKNLTMATSISLCGGTIGGLLVPVVTRLIDILDWRTAMLAIGVAAWFIILPLSFVVRHKPEQYGYLPDGVEAKDATFQEIPQPERDHSKNIGIRQILKTRPFWHISLGFLCHYLVVSSVLTHIMPYLGSIGISRSSASFITSVMPFASISGRLGFGWFGDKFEKKRVVVTSLIFTILGFVLLILVDITGKWMLVPFIIIFGLGWGGPVPLALGLLQQHFGRFRLGTVVGLCTGVIMLGNIFGPPMAGWVYDRFGSYHNAWIICIVVITLGLVSLMTIPKADSVNQGNLEQIR